VHFYKFLNQKKKNKILTWLGLFEKIEKIILYVLYICVCVCICIYLHNNLFFCCFFFFNFFSIEKDSRINLWTSV